MKHNLHTQNTFIPNLKLSEQLAMHAYGPMECLSSWWGKQPSQAKKQAKLV